MKKTSINNKQYQAFYKKRLQTESFLDTEMSSTNMSSLTRKIISSLKNANKNSSQTQQKTAQVKSRLKTKQCEEEVERDLLRSKIKDKMRISAVNLEKVNKDRKRALSSRSQFQSTQRSKIRQREKTSLERSLLKARQTQRSTEKFFRDTSLRKKEQNNQLQRISRQRERQRYRQNQEDGNYNDMSASNSTIRSGDSRFKPIVKVLKVSDTDILNKQAKKKDMDMKKQSRYLSQYISKMEEIVKGRKNSTKKPKEAKPTFPKIISNEKPQINRVVHRTNKMMSPLFHANASKASFSEQYQKKLSEKRQKKQQYHSLILQKGDEILGRQLEQTRAIKQKKIIQDSLNDYRRWSNYQLNG